MLREEPGRLGYRPALDGIRAIAVTLVILSHARVPYVAVAGQVGVTMFFVLSGFLITTLLLRERDRTGRIDRARFYLRRARRLLPALAVVIVTSLLVTAISGYPFTSWAGAGAVMFYCANILGWLGINIHAGVLGHTWSLTIEEQFYLLWPAVILLFAHRRRMLAILCCGGALVSLWLRFAVWDGVGAAPGYFHDMFGTDTRIDGILIGCALALLLDGRILRAPASWVLAGSIGGSLFLGALAESVTLRGGLTVAALFTCVTIYGVIAQDGPTWLGSRPLVWLGRRSYATYLWNYPLERFFDEAGLDHHGWLLRLAVDWSTSLLMAALSWRFIERPFLGDRQSPEARPAATEMLGIAVAS